MSKTFYSLRYHNYLLWFVSNLVSSTGQWMQRVAQDWLVLTILTDHSGLAVGVTTALQFLPQLLFSMHSGLLADRFNRRHMLQVTQVITAVLSVVMGVLVLVGHAQLWEVYVIAFLAGTANTVGTPARQTFVSELVPPKDLPNAVGLNSTAFNAARMIGPAVAGVTIAAVGPGWVFLINAALFLVPIIALGMMRVADLREVPSAPRHKGMIREGLAYVRGRSDIVLITLVTTVMSMLGFNHQLTQGVMATTVYGKGAGEYGLLGSVMAIGSLGGALVAARRSRPRVALVFGSALAYGVCQTILALAPTYTWYAILLIPTGFLMLTVITAANATIQVSTPPEVRGRVLSIYFLFYLGVTPLGSPLVGWIAEQFGARWSVGIGGVVPGLTALVAMIIAWRTWDVEVVQTERFPWIQVLGPRERALRAEEAQRIHDIVDPVEEREPVTGAAAARHAAREVARRLRHPSQIRRGIAWRVRPRLRRGRSRLRRRPRLRRRRPGPRG
ncbi:MAG: MFS transporter [Actinomycetaceae bacterium]|nr:MFS transporter [Actinomycetaceae bacterium]MDU0969773.1 MFS transporter [Actinomycetaceae bacterium]